MTLYDDRVQKKQPSERILNIDLLVTQKGDVGLVCDQGFKSPVTGAMFDAQTRQLSLEFSNLDCLDLNIPVEDDITETLLWAQMIQVGVIVKGKIQDNRQVALMLLNDPFDEPGMNTPLKPSNSVLAFEAFLKSCISGQPLHRDDLGDEDSSNSVMSGINRSVLEFAPHLARQRTMEAAPHLANTPKGPSMGLGGGGGGGSRGGGYIPPLRERPEDDEDSGN